MSIAIESSDELEKLRMRLRKMSDDELVRFGKGARNLCRDPRCPDTFKLQLEEAKAEWRRQLLEAVAEFVSASGRAGDVSGRPS